MFYTCNVRTVRGQKNLSIEMHARNQNIAYERALAQAEALGLAPTGRCRVTKVQPRRGAR